MIGAKGYIQIDLDDFRERFVLISKRNNAFSAVLSATI